MKIVQSTIFVRKVKKFHKDQKLELDEALKKLVKDPTIGEEKRGDLKDIFIYKFKISTIQYLLAYRYTKDVLELITIDPHENYYRDLKTYLKSK